jgi:hypothetical protein
MEPQDASADRGPRRGRVLGGAVVAVLLLAAVVVALGDDDSTVARRGTGDASSAPGSGGAVAARDGALAYDELVPELISEADWPLTVRRGTLTCVDGLFVVYAVGGVTYAVNGTARGRGYDEIEPIWADDPEIEGIKVSIKPLIDVGLSLC